MAISNPRFPHTLVVTREENVGSTYEPNIQPVVILSCECRNYITTKSTESNGVVSSNYTVALPVHSVNILTGDKIVVTDTVRSINGEIVASQIGNLGANIYYNEVKN